MTRRGPRNGILLVCALAGAQLSGGDARAWEAACRGPGDVWTTPGAGGLPRMNLADRSQPNFRSSYLSICDMNAPSLPECADGLAAARGVFTGEHRYITDLALNMIGLGMVPTSSAVPVPAPVLGRWDSPGTSLFDYYVDGSTVAPPGVAGWGRLTPAGPAGMNVLQSLLQTLPSIPNVAPRTPWLAELAEVPDVSYSLSDYLLGNETCLPRYALTRYASEATAPGGIALADGDQIAACHAFKSHMGALNSTHFGAQAAAAYMLHHTIARTIAQRCAAMWTAVKALPPTSPQYALFKDHVVPSCEREAFAFEAVGVHYMEDAWSSGHMWERPGQPTFRKDPFGQLEQSALGAVAGLQHGWRYLAQTASRGLNGVDYFAVKAVDLEGAKHDQLCLAGPPAKLYADMSSAVAWNQSPLLMADAGDSVVGYTFADGGVPGYPQAAGGDLYLLGCNAVVENNVTWAVSGPVPAGGAAGNALYSQDVRMGTCVAFGFDEIYKAGPGPDTAYRPGPMQPQDGAPPFDQAIVAIRGQGFYYDDPSKGTTDLYNACFGQHVTNHAMRLGFGITDWGDYDSLSFKTHLVVDELPGQVAGAAGLAAWAKTKHWGTRLARNGVSGTYMLPTALDAVGKKTMFDTVRFGQYLAQREKKARDGSEAARMVPMSPGTFDPGQLLDTPPGNQAAAVKAILVGGAAVGGVEYLEPANLSTWSAAPVDMVQCTSDRFCSDLADTGQDKFKGTFCDHSNGYDSSGTVTARCVPRETAVLRAFRAGEAAYWCKNDTADDYEAARRTCQVANSGGLPNSYTGVPACEACAELLVPHLRGTCNAKSYALTNSSSAGAGRASACDMLLAANTGNAIWPAGSAPAASTLDANSVYAPFDPNNPGEALDAARAICGVLPKVPVDPSPTAAPLPGNAFIKTLSILEGTTGLACFNTCDACTTCVTGQYAVGGPLASLPGGQGVYPVGVQAANAPSRWPLFGAESDIIDIAGWGAAMCAVRSDGSVECVGDNSQGALGVGSASPVSSTVPQPVMLNPKPTGGIVHLFNGASTMFAVDASGAAWCWGDDSGGQCGDGASQIAYTPIPLPVTDVAEIANVGTDAGGALCVRTKAAGNVWCGHGTAGFVQVPSVSGATKLGSNRRYLTASGVFTWLQPVPCVPGPGQTCCPNVVPVTGIPFAVEQLGGLDTYFYGAGNAVATTSDPMVTDPVTGCPTAQPVKVQSTGPFVADVVVGVPLGFLGSTGNQLTAWPARPFAGQSLPVPLSSNGLPVVALEAPASCK